jgi:hypothetical protein
MVQNHMERAMDSRIRKGKTLIYPPELLPPPEPGEAADVFVCLDHRGDRQCPNCVRLPSEEDLN